MIVSLLYVKFAQNRANIAFQNRIIGFLGNKHYIQYLSTLHKRILGPLVVQI